MTSRTSERLRGAAALAALLLILVGPPLALVRLIGWPLPTTIPSLDEVNLAARSGIDPMTVVKVLAVLAWICWTQLALAALAEIIGVARGRAARRMPGLPAFQAGMGKLATTAALLLAGIAVARPQPLPAARLAAAVARPADTTLPARPPATVTPARPTTSPADPQPQARTYVVQRNDSWWEIAERTLGDGQRWRELRDLNAGRTMHDGTTITAATEIIRPGWQLLVSDTGAELGESVEGHSADASEVTVEPGDNIWDISARHLRDVADTPTGSEIRDYWRETIDANRGRLAEPTNPNLIFAGQVLELPAIGTPTATPDPETPSAAPSPSGNGASPSATSPTHAPPTTGTTTSGQSREGHRFEDAGQSRADESPVTAGILGTASTALAVGIGAAAARRRRRRLLQVPAGHQPPPPPADLDDLRAEIAANADVDRADTLAAAARDVAHELARQSANARPMLVQVTGDRVEVSLSCAVAAAPDGWHSEASGLVWVCDEPTTAGAGDRASALPALVTVGRADDGAELYLDLEAAGVVTVTGDDALDAARSWILELATSPHAAGASVTIIGDGLLPTTDTSERVRLAQSWDEVTGDARAWAEQTAGLLAAHRWPTPVAGRAVAQRDDDLAPLLVFSTAAPQGEDVDELLSLVAEQHTAVTVVLAGYDVESAMRIDVRDGELRVPQIGLTCAAQLVDAPVADEIARLLDDAATLPAQLELIPRPAPRPPVTVGSPDDEYHDPPYEILVRLLGDIAVLGASKPLKPKQVAVLAYIALNGPVAAERVEDALWVAPTSSRHKRLANTVSETRTAIGAAHLPAANDGRYRVGPGVVTDIDVFERRLAFAASQSDDVARQTLRGALELVEGPVFTYRNAERASYVWVDVENWHSTWELHVTNAAEDLAQRCLDTGDVDGAIWAARQGLNAARIHPRLTKLLIQAHFVNRDTNAAEQVFESYQSALEQLDLDDVDPELFDFYQSARRARGVGVS